MITRIRVKNFRSLADVDVRLGPLTVLIGKNGAGKSAFLDVLRFVRDALRLNLEEALTKRHGISMLQTNWNDNLLHDIEIALSVQSPNFCAEYGFGLGSGSQQANAVTYEYFRLQNEAATWLTIYEAERGSWKVAPPASIFAPGSSERLNNMRIDTGKLFLPVLSAVMPDAAYMGHFLQASDFYRVFPTDDLRRPQAAHIHHFPLAEDGSNLAPLLWHLQSNGGLPVIIAALRSAVPDIEDLRVEKRGGYVFAQVRHRRSTESRLSEWFDLEQESDGTVHLLAVLAALYQNVPYNPALFSVIGIEEPETALYPAALGVLGDVIKEATCRSQVIVATQSPDFISEFDIDSLRIVEKREGKTHIGPIEERQREAINSQLFTTGDLLRIEGLHSLPIEAVSVEYA